ncbi:vWA domain-containing protein [Rhizobium oryzicola]|uniref:VWA domain-containing protein n=1 Tax=Rhizobium oryzicola TaxID=1232668 RepID=A0ABT8SU60_9HYPH|nr:TadE/TadG family type IV pilus assembly protein [Rhizobium oryzicola]MDO1581952.1 VWA domain-containing protein [Rhizobium oryzicola]
MNAFSITRLLKDRGGNFAMMSALLFPITIGVAGIALDVNNAMQKKNDIQATADAAALAAASAMAQKGMPLPDAQTLARDILASQLLDHSADSGMSDADRAALKDEIKKATVVSSSQTVNTGSSKGFQLKLETAYNLQLNPITSLIAGKTVTIRVISTASSNMDTQNGISMYLALDRSGSMSFITDQKNPSVNSCSNYTEDSWPNAAFYYPCYIRKVEALKTAANVLFNSLNKSDPAGTLVRVGAVSYTDQTQQPTPISWGTAAASSYVSALPNRPTGGTDATGAMKIAYDALKSSNSTEASAQKAKGNDSFNRFIVLMTDGEMTGNSSYWDSSLDQQVRTSCAAAKNDGIKIFTVAFMAPTRGKSLLSYCASSSDYYYEPDDMAELVQAFGDIANKAAKSATRLTN